MHFAVDGWEFDGCIEWGGDISIQLFYPLDQTGATAKGEWIEPEDLAGREWVGDIVSVAYANKLAAKAENHFYAMWCEAHGSSPHR